MEPVIPTITWPSTIKRCLLQLSRKKILRSYNVQGFWINTVQTDLAVVHQFIQWIDTLFCSSNRSVRRNFTSIMNKTAEDLCEILQHIAKSMYIYIEHFDKENVSIPGCNASTSISACKRGMLPAYIRHSQL